MKNPIEFDVGWNLIQEEISKFMNFLESGSSEKYTIGAEKYMMLYTTILDMCTQHNPHDYSQQLHQKYCETFEDYIISNVLPLLFEKHGELLLREFVKRWSNHKIMVKWLSRFFQYLDRYYIRRRSLPTLEETGLNYFRDLVYKISNKRVLEAVISLINKEREGEQIDQALVKNTVDASVEIREAEMFENDFENAIFKDATTYYSRMASAWIVEGSSTTYLLKAEESLKQEKDRIAYYLRQRSQTKLLEKVQRALLTTYAAQLPEKVGSEAFLENDKGKELSKKYLLFSNIPKDLEPIANKVMQHVLLTGGALVEEDEDFVVV